MARNANDSGAPPPVFYEITEGLLILRFRSAEFSLAEAMEVRDIIYEKLKGVAKNIILNLNGVTYVDSTAISLLVRISNELGLRIVNVSETVAHTLRKMRIFDLLYILPSEYEARRSFFEV
ncbi:MAG: STAS domain-containing protein [Planctomycetota bacterium]|jgi:anti-anti-sigma factor